MIGAPTRQQNKASERFTARAGAVVRVHVPRRKDRIIGATIVASDAGDVISEITLAMTHKLGLRKIADTIHPSPTHSEAIRQLGEAYNRPFSLKYGNVSEKIQEISYCERRFGL